MSGRIVLPVVKPEEGPAPFQQKGSNIQAAAEVQAEKTTEQAEAVSLMAGKMNAGRRKRGGAEVEVHPPNTVSAGNVNHGEIFANILGAKAQLEEQSKYDALGDAPAYNVNGGAKRRTHKKHNARRSTHNTRKHRGAVRKHRIFRNSRRRVHSRSR